VTSSESRGVIHYQCFTTVKAPKYSLEKAQMNTTAAQMKGKRWSCCTCLYVL